MTRLRTRLEAAFGIALATLRHDRTRTILAALGIALAVLATTLLASVGAGVVETGQEKFSSSGRDLWVTGGPVQFAPGSVGGFEASIRDSHRVANEIGSHPSVRIAAPMAFQTVYVGTSPDNLSRVVGVGVPFAAEGTISVTKGSTFSDHGDPHYANGSYDGPLTKEIIIDPQIADRFGVSVGDTIHVGGTLQGATRNEYRVVGISPTFTRFLGSPTVTLHLSELQTMTQTAYNDEAAMITVQLEDGANPEAVERDLQTQFPQYDVRTNQEQFRAVLENKAVVIAAGSALVVLAVIAGLALTINLLALLIYQQRDTIAALRAIGLSTLPLVGAFAIQGVVLGVLGGAVGLAATPLFAVVLNRIAASVVGFEGLVQTPPMVYVAGGGIAVVVGTIAAVVAGWRVASVDPNERLD